MTHQELTNLKRRIRRDFAKDQANDLLIFLDAVDKLAKIVEKNEIIMRLLDTRESLKISVLVRRLREAGIEIDTTDLIVEPEERGEGISNK